MVEYFVVLRGFRIAWILESRIEEAGRIGCPQNLRKSTKVELFGQIFVGFNISNFDSQPVRAAIGNRIGEPFSIVAEFIHLDRTGAFLRKFVRIKEDFWLRLIKILHRVQYVLVL